MSWHLRWPTWRQTVGTDGSFWMLRAYVEILALLLWQWHGGGSWLLYFWTQGVEERTGDTAAHASLLWWLYLQETFENCKYIMPTENYWGKLFKPLKLVICWIVRWSIRLLRGGEVKRKVDSWVALKCDERFNKASTSNAWKGPILLYQVISSKTVKEIIIEDLWECHLDIDLSVLKRKLKLSHKLCKSIDWAFPWIIFTKLPSKDKKIHVFSFPHNAPSNKLYPLNNYISY